MADSLDERTDVRSGEILHSRDEFVRYRLGVETGIGEDLFEAVAFDVVGERFADDLFRQREIERHDAVEAVRSDEAVGKAFRIVGRRDDGYRHRSHAFEEIGHRLRDDVGFSALFVNERVDILDNDDDREFGVLVDVREALLKSDAFFVKKVDEVHEPDVDGIGVEMEGFAAEFEFLFRKEVQKELGLPGSVEADRGVVGASGFAMLFVVFAGKRPDDVADEFAVLLFEYGDVEGRDVLGGKAVVGAVDESSELLRIDEVALRKKREVCARR